MRITTSTDRKYLWRVKWDHEIKSVIIDSLKDEVLGVCPLKRVKNMYIGTVFQVESCDQSLMANRTTLIDCFNSYQGSFIDGTFVKEKLIKTSKMAIFELASTLARLY